MKKRTKIIAASLSALIIISGVGMGASIPVGGVTKVNYQFIVNGKKIEIPSYLTIMNKDNATYVPLRFLSENMGLDVEYKPGTVKVSSNQFNETRNEEIKAEMEKLKDEIKTLKTDNERLKARLGDFSSQNYYSEIPVYTQNGAGLGFGINNIQKENESTLFYVQTENTNTDKSYTIDPFKTELLVDGEVYKATIRTDSSLNSTLSAAKDKYTPTQLIGRIYFEGLETTRIKGILLIKYTAPGESEKIMQLPFDNAK